MYIIVNKKTLETRLAVPPVLYASEAELAAAGDIEPLALRSSLPPPPPEVELGEGEVLVDTDTGYYDPHTDSLKPLTTPPREVPNPLTHLFELEARIMKIEAHLGLATPTPAPGDAPPADQDDAPPPADDDAPAG